MNETILIIDDERKITDFLRRGLTLEGFQVHIADDGERGLEAALREPPDLVILDIMLPGINGLEVCRRLRETDADLSILMLTARDAVSDRVAGLDTGADDYLVKPFALEELLARVRALLRRQGKAGESQSRFGDLLLDRKTREVWRGERRIELSGKEFDLLEYLMRHPRQALSRDQLYEAVWGYDFGGESNILDVYVRYLRTKLEAGGEPRLIQTMRGVGYALREEP
jgi:two-component system response regulator MprA